MNRGRSREKDNRGCCRFIFWMIVFVSVTGILFAPKNTGSAAETDAPTASDRSFDLLSVPEYAGSPTAEVNGNIPFFEADDRTTQSFERYGDLDRLGRCTAAFACVGADLMPTEPRGEIGSIKPTGWHLVRYAGIDGDYLYNRCHLIAYELSGENENEKNLITGTRYLNVEGMLPYENQTADYVRSTGHHVLYRVTPIFEGDNLLASGLLMEGESVEDDGIRFCVYAYNVQPGVTIDYATGDSSGEEYTGDDAAAYDGVDFSSPAIIRSVQTALNNAGYDCGRPDGAAGSKTCAAAARFRADKGLSGSGIDAHLAMALGLGAYDLLRLEQTAESGSPAEAAEATDQGTSISDGDRIAYVVNTNTGKFHDPGCPSVEDIADRNRMDYAGSRDELIAQGYQPCRRCNP